MDCNRLKNPTLYLLWVISSDPCTQFSPLYLVFLPHPTSNLTLLSSEVISNVLYLYPPPFHFSIIRPFFRRPSPRSLYVLSLQVISSDPFTNYSQLSLRPSKLFELISQCVYLFSNFLYFSLNQRAQNTSLFPLALYGHCRS